MSSGFVTSLLRFALDRSSKLADNLWPCKDFPGCFSQSIRMKNEREDEICVHKRIAVSTKANCIRNPTVKHRLTAVAGN